MSENILFVLPATLEEALWTLPCVSQYLETRLVMMKEIRDSISGFKVPARKGVGQVSFVCPFPSIHSLVKSVWNKLEVTSSLEPQQKENADLVIDFNPKLAYEVTKTIGKHITEAYGIQLGCIPMASLPAIAQKIVKEESGSVLVVRRSVLDDSWGRPTDWLWPHEDAFAKGGLEGGLPIKLLDGSESYEEMSKAVSRASVVVGVRGSATLLAASFRKVVMELCPDNFEHKGWMSKWECKTYRMIYGSLGDMTAWFVWDRLNKLVAEVSKMRGPELWAPHQSITSAVVLETVAESIPMGQ